MNLNDHIDKVQDIIGYRFDNLALLRQAFTRSSYSNQYGSENNEVLEFLGDRILDMYVAKIIADEFGFMKSQSDYYDPEEDADEFCIVANKREGDFTDLKKEIVSNETLASIIDEWKFAPMLWMGDSDVQNHVERQTKVKADLFEAIIGAIAIDCGWDPETLENCVARMLDIDSFLDDVDTEEQRPKRFREENAINTLKEIFEKGRCSEPEYYLPENQVADGNGKLWWSCTCTVRSWKIQKTGFATSKKLAKKYAAYLVLCEKYGLEDEFSNND